jgi:DNA helicase II / ATP-dependent DNA helicase PcrA
MPAKDHYAYKEEQLRLKNTLGYVEKTFENMLKEKDRIDEKTTEGKRSAIGDNSQEYIEFMINNMFKESIKLKLRNLETARNKPYFSRIDFKEIGKKELEKIYIGKMCLIKDENQEMLIVDWRAPTANLYYEERLGDASYNCPDGKIKGDLSLKRQFSVDKGMLKEIFDIDITTNDEFLQGYLGASADNRLKDIVSTIQWEQNRVIRADMWKPLIVQGAAGSGKTTIALHRIAYLIYTFEKSFEPENFMIIAPSRLFLNYISEVLPELGVERVKQATFEDFAMELIGQKFKIRDANEKLTLFVNSNVSIEEKWKNKLIEKVSELKASMVFRDALDEYIKTVEEDFIPGEDFKIGTYVLFTYEEINNLFLYEYSNLPMAKRIQEIKKHLTSRINLRKDDILERIGRNCDLKIRHLKDTMEDDEERRKLIVATYDDRDANLASTKETSKKAVREYISKISKIDPYKYYIDLFENIALWEECLSGKASSEIIEFTRAYTLGILRSGTIEIEDLAPMIYLKYKIHGMDEKIPVKHIVVDEAQDFSAFQFYVIKRIVKDSSFTILGDLCQGIHSYRGIKDWEDLRKYVFEDIDSGMLTLEQSYRTTVEIMDAANQVIRKMEGGSRYSGRPVIRHGEEVRIIRTEGIEEMASEINIKIKEFKKLNYMTIAVICKTMEDCNRMSALLKKGKDSPKVITGGEKEYKGGIVIVPSYLAKGLEFDAVLIAGASTEEYKAIDLDIKLLYVAMTRPLHKLYIYYCNELTELLRG